MLSITFGSGLKSQLGKCCFGKTNVSLGALYWDFGAPFLENEN